jgi:ComF family protein
MARAFAAYDRASETNPVANAIARFKYGGARRFGRRFAALVLARVPDATVGLVVPVPLHRRRLRQRGFNQSAVLARHIARALGARVALTAVIRHRDTPSQVGLGPAERAHNVADAFAIRDRSAIDGHVVLVVDDVWTSGATVRALAHVLRDAGRSPSTCSPLPACSDSAPTAPIATHPPVGYEPPVSRNRDRRHAWEDRHRADNAIAPPSAFIVEALDVLRARHAAATPRRALDVASGRGRHALVLAREGYDVVAVDFAVPALATLARTANARGLAVACLAADVTAWPLPVARFGLVVVVDFLERALFPALRAAAPRRRPAVRDPPPERRPERASALRPEFVLAPGEIDELGRDWCVLLRHDAHVLHRGTPAIAPASRPNAHSARH